MIYHWINMIKCNILISFHHEKSRSLNLYNIHEQETKIQEKTVHLFKKGPTDIWLENVCSVYVRSTHFIVNKENQNVFYFYLHVTGLRYYTTSIYI
jgi:hypothetical protein